MLASNSVSICGRTPQHGMDATAPQTVIAPATYGWPGERRKTSRNAAAMSAAKPAISPPHPAMRYKTKMKTCDSHS